MWGGALLIVAGAWVLSQVLGGDALGRLGITGAGTGNGIASAVGGLIPGRGTSTNSNPGTGAISGAVGGLIPGRN